MRIITYSDLHLEFGSGWMLPPDAAGDVLILAGNQLGYPGNFNTFECKDFDAAGFPIDVS